MNPSHDRQRKRLPSLSWEWLLMGALVIIIIGFTISYTRLFYELHQAKQALHQAQQELRQEELRQRDLEKVYQEVQNGGEALVDAIAPRALRLAKPGTEIWQFDGDTSLSPGPEDAPPPTPTPEPIWHRWARLFHLGGEK
ncbi:MAG: hypothetical protein GXO55_05645 [Chloroflexi bacterium]|nr:hypothetical protein [Chloroflexota bacterium]